MSENFQTILISVNFRGNIISIKIVGGHFNKPSETSDRKSREISLKHKIKKYHQLKEELKDQVVVLGHHYQSDQIIQFADYKGDSLALAKEAANLDKPYIIFCGVHFMAETADMLTKENQKVILPDLNAGCSMADMANNEEIEKSNVNQMVEFGKLHNFLKKT